MRDQRTEAQGAKDKNVDAPPAIEAGDEAKTNFHAQGTIPPVGSAEPPAPAASASDLAFGDTTGGGGRAAAGAAGGGGGGGGQPLPDDLRAKFEASLGVDLSGVRIHTDGAADAQTKAHGAKATATGQDIHLAPGKYDPHSAEGQELLAHEVAHTVQQKHAAPMAQAKKAEAVPSASSGPEKEADGAAAAMVGGKQATVTPVAEQAPHAVPGDYGDQVKQYKHALDTSNWSDAALRLNGFSNDDIKAFVHDMTPGRRAHVSEAAETAMPGWAQRVTGPIKIEDEGAAGVAALYAAYEKAVVTAKSSGNWSEVVDRLNGMGDWDQQDRLKKLTWFDYEAMRAQTTNARVLAAIDKADTARVQRAQAAYADAIKTQDWLRASQQLHGFDADGRTAALDELASKPETVSFLKRIKEAAPNDPVVVEAIDRVAKAHGEVVPNPLVLTPVCELPDVSDDTRALKGLDLTNFAGNAKIQKFASDLESVYNAHRGTSGRTDKTKTDAALSDHFQTSFSSTATHYVNAVAPTMKLSTFAHQWMSEMRERADLDSGTKLDDAKLPTGIGKMQFSEADLATLDKKNGFSDGEVKNKAGDIIKQGQRVHPFVNNFMEVLATKGTGFTSSTYPNHGGSPEIAPFCLDVFPRIKLDDRGLYQPDQMIEFIEKINAAAGGGNWSGIYNDTAVLRELPTRGLGGKVDTQAKDGTNNFHGALNLHIHLYLRPPPDWAPGAPDPKSVPPVDLKNEPH